MLGNYCVIDLETNGLPEKGKLPSITCFAWCDGEKSGVGTLLSELKELLEGKIPVFHNAKFDVPILRAAGFPIPLFQDTMLMSYVLDTNDDHSLKAKGAKGEYDFKTKGFKLTNELIEYAEQDARVTWDYFAEVFDKIFNDLDNATIYDLELSFLECIMEYEANGLPVDVDEAVNYRNELVFTVEGMKRGLVAKCPKVPCKKLKTYKKEHPELGQYFVSNPSEKEWNYQLFEDFNFNSRHHKAYLLKQAGWKPFEFSKDGTPKLDAAVINKIKGQYAEAEVLQDISKINKTLSTFINALVNERDEDNFVHTNVNQTVTRTGRLSSSRPNVQNLPSRGETGDKIRSLIKAPYGHVLIGADLSNIEARVLAYYLNKMCHDSYLKDVFKSGEDFHDTNAASWDLTRDMAKKVLYLTLYGGGAQKLAQDADIPLAEAEVIFAKFHVSLPSVGALKDLAKKYVLKNGFIKTILGRKIYYPTIYSNDEELRAKAERQLFNALLQGSAADIIKSLSVDVLPISRKYKIKSLIQVHDENVWMSKDMSFVDDFMNEASELWNSSKHLGDLPIVSEFKKGLTWAEIH